MSKRLFFLFLFVLLSASSAWACEVCGCATGSYYLGIMPQQQQHFLGWRYRYARYESHGGLANAGANQVFHTNELFGRWFLLPRWQILAFLPYHYNRHLEPTRSINLSGWGDPLAMVQYQVWNTARGAATPGWRHQLQLGAGLKAPLGRYHYTDDPTQVANPNFQVGTGSTDALLAAIYTLRNGRWGLQVESTRKFNGQNSNDYTFGRRQTLSTSTFLLQTLNRNTTLMAQVGWSYEHNASDQARGYPVAFTGGALQQLQLGLEVFLGQNWSAGGKIQLPLQQSLGGGHLTVQKSLNFQLLWLW